MYSECFEHLVDLYLSISTCFILEVLYKNLDHYLLLMTAIECFFLCLVLYHLHSAIQDGSHVCW